MVGMKMRHQDRVDVVRLDPHGMQIVGEHAERRAHADPATRVDQHPPARDLDEESVHRHFWRNGSEGDCLEPLAFRMVDPDDEIERGLERPIIDGGHESVANHEMVESGRLASRKFDRFTHQESPDFLPIASRSTPIEGPAAQSCGWLSPRRPFVDPRPADRRHRIVNRNDAVADGEDRTDGMQSLPRTRSCLSSNALKPRLLGS